MMYWSRNTVKMYSVVYFNNVCVVFVVLTVRCCWVLYPKTSVSCPNTRQTLINEAVLIPVMAFIYLSSFNADLFTC